MKTYQELVNQITNHNAALVHARLQNQQPITAQLFYFHLQNQQPITAQLSSTPSLTNQL